MKYIYSGPASGVTLADGQEMLTGQADAKSRYRKITVGNRHDLPAVTGASGYARVGKLMKRKLSMAANYLHGGERP